MLLEQSPLPTLIGTEVLQALSGAAAQTPPGSFVEVGVYKGGSAQWLHRIASIQGRKLFLFDTFTGIPFQGASDRHRVGDFGDTSYAEVRAKFPDEVSITQGLFPASASIIELGPIGFVHLDCDQYQSIIESFRYLEPKLVPGGMVWFDDPSSLKGAMLAAKELCGNELVEHPCGKHYWVKPS